MSESQSLQLVDILFFASATTQTWPEKKAIFDLPDVRRMDSNSATVTMAKAFAGSTHASFSAIAVDIAVATCTI